MPISIRRTLVGIHSEILEVVESHPIEKDCSILQAEMDTIERAVKSLLQLSDKVSRYITTYCDSQVSLRALESKKIDIGRSRDVAIIFPVL